MAVNIAEYVTKLQEESLAALKQTQENSLAAMHTMHEMGKEFAANPGTVPAIENLPTPTQLVELSFGFASQVLELRKAFTLKVAEMIVDTQKQVESNFKAAVGENTSK